MAAKLKWYEKGAELPKSVGACADLFKEVESLYRDMKSETDDVYERLGEIREHIIANLSKSDDTGASGLKYRAQVKSEAKPKAADWDKIYAYITKHKRFDLLQRRLSEKAVMELYEAEGMPGIERIHVKKVSITKI